MPIELDDDLPAWKDVSAKRDWSGLLLGNGFSQNIWKRFGYASLYETARSNEVTPNLDQADQGLFDKFDTRNFELVLTALSVGRRVNTALEHQTDYLDNRYDSIRKALIAAVHYVHVPWIKVPEETLKAIAGALALHESVYSTNYDLLAYWAIMAQPASFKDYFWAGPEFDISNTEVWGKCTKMHYLHGGLHLYRRPDGQTLKRPALEDENLLDLFGQPFHNAVPLFVSEGTASQKRVSIYRSEYLSFAFSQFSQDAGPMVVFGHSLSANDDHIVKALQAHGSRALAVSLLPGPDTVKRKAEIVARLPKADILFFDATTHPLGSADLSIEEEEA